MVTGLAGLAVAGAGTAAGTTLARRQRPYLPRAHAGRDDARRDPLTAALRAGCAGLTVGVEAGVDGRLRLPGDDPGRTLEAMIVRPLAGRVESRGRVYPAQAEPFTVVVEPVAPLAPEALDQLHEVLCAYDGVLSRSRGGLVTAGAVTLVLAGPRRLLAARPDRFLFAEGTLDDVGRSVPAALVPLASEHVAWRLGWDGHGEMAVEERHLLRSLVHAAHAEGKRVRFFGVPERRPGVRRAFWRELHAAGVDLIATHRVGALRRFLRTQHAHRQVASRGRQRVNVQ